MLWLVFTICSLRNVKAEIYIEEIEDWKINNYNQANNEISSLNNINIKVNNFFN